MIYVYCVLTPLVVCQWDIVPWLGAIVCLVSVVCMTSLDLIASELENPFGEDDNDLLVYEMQESFNSVVVCRK